jgi:HD-GYP domain-containing protein (c-di-GMP phosphodiesterase class II)
MSDAAVRSLLTAIRRAASHHRIYGEDHEITAAAVSDVVDALNGLVGTADRAMLSLVDDTLYLNRSPMASVSVEFNGLIRSLQETGIESIVFEHPVRREDTVMLTRFIAGAGSPPTKGSITLNEDSWARTELEDSPTEGLRQAYSSSLIALRSIGSAVQEGTNVELTQATAAVTSLLEHVIAQPEAAFLLTTVKSHHEYTFYHSVNTSIMSIALGRLIGVGEQDLLVLGLGALLHDIGKLGVSAGILQHPGRLGPDDWVEIKRHPVLGAEMILAAAAPGHEAAAVVAFEHHAGFDGRGYPTIPHHRHDDHDHDRKYKSGDRLHLFSRLAAVVDTYDAITTRRAYRRAERPSRALHALLAGAGRSHDPDLVQAFIGLVGVYPPGSKLLLDDGRIVVVIRSTEGSAERPTAAVLTRLDGTRLEQPELIELDPRHIADQVMVNGGDQDAAALLELLTVS